MAELTDWYNNLDDWNCIEDILTDLNAGFDINDEERLWFLLAEEGKFVGFIYPYSLVENGKGIYICSQSRPSRHEYH